MLEFNLLRKTVSTLTKSSPILLRHTRLFCIQFLNICNSGAERHLEPAFAGPQLTLNKLHYSELGWARLDSACLGQCPARSLTRINKLWYHRYNPQVLNQLERKVPSETRGTKETHSQCLDSQPPDREIFQIPRRADHSAATSNVAEVILQEVPKRVSQLSKCI
jgi:hypothetical protein